MSRMNSRSVHSNLDLRQLLTEAQYSSQRDEKRCSASATFCSLLLVALITIFLSDAFECS